MNYRFLALAALLFCACGDKNPATTQSETPASDTAISSARYFPVLDFLRGEIAQADSLPVGIMQYRTSAAATDSGYIQREEFRKLAAEFVPAELNDSIFKKEFRETSFIDKSSGGATFFYNTDNRNLNLKRVDVVTEKTDTYDKVRSIYLEKQFEKDNNLVIKKLFWKPGKNFQIITQVTKDPGTTETDLVKVVWDNSE